MFNYELRDQLRMFNYESQDQLRMFNYELRFVRLLNREAVI